MWTHHLLHCPTYRNKRVNFLNETKNVSIRILDKTDSILSQIPPYFCFSFDRLTKTFIVNSTVQYMQRNVFRVFFDACDK